MFCSSVQTIPWHTLKGQTYWVWMYSVCCSVSVSFCSAIAKGELCRPACENGGRCVANEKGDWRCYCWPDFSGERCEINHCTDYCLNGGTCTGSPLGKENLYLSVSLLRIFLDFFYEKAFTYGLHPLNLFCDTYTQLNVDT